MPALLALILPLALETFGVAAALGAAGGLTARDRRRLSALFVGCEALMPLAGLTLGAPLGRAIGGAAELAAIALLLALGLLALLRSDDDDVERLVALAGRRGPAALLLGLAVSVDELAIGVTLGLLDLPVAVAVALIAAQAVVAAQVGLRLGARLGARAGEAAERLTGAALIALGLALLAARLAG